MIPGSGLGDTHESKKKKGNESGVFCSVWGEKRKRGEGEYGGAKGYRGKHGGKGGRDTLRTEREFVAPGTFTRIMLLACVKNVREEQEL